jgi:DNA invertase Pin-like site-specific DNA recombinase
MPRIQPLRNVALCYVRNSWTKDERDFISPERQRERIQAVCDERGWVPEWYEDAEGHKPGTSEKNRPSWLALKARIRHPTVVALVANDLARLHRNVKRMMTLFDTLTYYNVQLVTADKNYVVDITTPEGLTQAIAQAEFDERYVTDISARRKADIEHRKAQGKTVGLPPFGTKRDRQKGYLTPTDEGAWLLPDGRWVAGIKDENPPQEDAIWKGYYECAERILQLYTEGLGRDSIARIIHTEGWAYRNRQGQPVPIDADGIRRATANWAEYGGYVSGKRARERTLEDLDPENIIPHLKPDRAVFPLDLIAKVGREWANRVKPAPFVAGEKRIYPLSDITYCAHCEHIAQKHNNPKLRTRLAGRLGIYYRHQAGEVCGCINQSVRCEDPEAVFVQFVQSLQVKPEYQQLESISQVVAERKLTDSISYHLYQIQGATHQFGDRQLELNDYLHLVEWHARKVDEERERLQVVRLQGCLEVLQTLQKKWDELSADKQERLAEAMFEYMTFNLDQQVIIEFKLKPLFEELLELS